MLNVHLIFWYGNFVECTVFPEFLVIHPSLRGNCAFSQNFCTRKLVNIIVFHAVKPPYAIVIEYQMDGVDHSCICMSISSIQQIDSILQVYNSFCFQILKSNYLQLTLMLDAIKKTKKKISKSLKNCLPTQSELKVTKI